MSDNLTLYHGDMREILAELPENSVDSCVCDPPYELAFMSRGWDASGVSFQPETWEAVWRVLKPGGFLFAFGGTRTFHRIACAIEDAGFEIRESLAWMFATGLPKTSSVERAVAEYLCDEPGRHFWYKRSLEAKQKITGEQPGDHVCAAREESEAFAYMRCALKAAFEPIIVARKALIGTIAENVLEYGTGGFNIDGCRLKRPADDRSGWGGGKGTPGPEYDFRGHGTSTFRQSAPLTAEEVNEIVARGRYPANVVFSHTDDCVLRGTKRVPSNNAHFVHTQGNDVSRGHVFGKAAYNNDTLKQGVVGYADADNTEPVEDWECSPECPVRLLDEQSGNRPSSPVRETVDYRPNAGAGVGMDKGDPIPNATGYGDKGGASRFYFCAKPSVREREVGLEYETSQVVSDGRETPIDNPYQRAETLRRNLHVTVKPVDLMMYLVRLVSPKHGTVLDPFMGSGTTGIAALLEGLRFIGIELEEESFRIAEKRIAAVPDGKIKNIDGKSVVTFRRPVIADLLDAC